MEGLSLVHHLPDPWNSLEPLRAAACSLCSHISPAEGCHQPDINYSFMNDLVSILAARDNLSSRDLAESAEEASCLLAGVSFKSPFWCFPFSYGSPLRKREGSFSSDRAQQLCQTPALPEREPICSLLSSSCFLVLLWPLQGPGPCPTSEPQGGEGGS